MSTLPTADLQFPVQGRTVDPYQERLSDLIEPFWGTYGIVYEVLQPLFW